MGFQHIYLLGLLIFPFLYIYRHIKGQITPAGTLRLPAITGFSVQKTWKMALQPHLYWFKAIGICFCIIALARPQTYLEQQNILSEGIDIVLTIDVSGSMMAADFSPNRLEAAKEKAKQFVEGRKGDRIGVVVFSGESYSECPLTTDHRIVTRLIDEVTTGVVADGTAIGMGLATAVNRLKESEAKSKIVILLTDGVNNAGSIDPQTAAELAQNYGIVVYTIGVGQKGFAPYPVQTPGGVMYQQMPVEIDEELLQKMAEQTGGKYFRATSNQDLSEIYTEIDKMEKSKIESSAIMRKTEWFRPFLAFGILLLLIEWVLRYKFIRALT